MINSDCTNSDILAEYINDVITLIINSEDCVKLINPVESEYYELSDILLGGEFEIEKDGQMVKEKLQPYIYDYCYTIGTTVEEKTMVCVDCTIDEMWKDILADFSLHIYVFTPKEINRISKYTKPTKEEFNSMGYYGNRVSALCSAIEKKLTGNKNIGIGNVRVANRGCNQIYIPQDGYYGRHLVFNVFGYDGGH